jgi:hypothetical protein
MVLGEDGTLYVSGYSNSDDFPVNPSSFDTLYSGGSIDNYGGDVFVSAFPASHFTDVDADNVVDFGDNCPQDYNPDQEDIDEDGVGDSCDNCPEDYNPDQTDENGNGVGDVCDYTCGDANSDQAVNILDISYIIAYLYSDGPAPDPIESANVNNDADVNILDISYLINYLYLGGPDPDCP